MGLIITVAYSVVLITSLFVILRLGKVKCVGPEPVGTFTLVALLFTAGLDMGLVMLPLVEFPIYAQEDTYNFTNPLAIEFGFWGPLVWMMYFLTCFYFVAIEPHLKVFQIPSVKYVYNMTIIATCAFTCYLFLTNLPSYAPEIPEWGRWAIGVGVILISVHSSSDFNFMKWLALLSTWGFGILSFVALVLIAFINSQNGFADLAGALGALMGYFVHLDRFVSPISDYHAFYLFWWFSWSIMIGEFTARYIGGLRAWKLAFAMIVLPTIPLGLWFAVLYLYFQKAITIPVWLNWMMISVGIVFVVNSLDSLIRLYSSNLKLDIKRLGQPVYYVTHFSLQFLLVLAYFFTPFKIEWVGLIVIGIYVVVYVSVIRKHSIVREAIAAAKHAIAS